MTQEKQRGSRNEVVGEVVSDKMNKTISVRTFRLEKHSKYGKYIRRSSVFKAHDEENQARIGDKVRIKEVRPLSKLKRWKLIELIEAAKGVR